MLYIRVQFNTVDSMQPVVTPTRARVFLGLDIPDFVKQSLYEGMKAYDRYIERTIPDERWHITLLFLGETANPKQYYSRLSKPLPQAYVPMVHVAYLGRGFHRGQLWAYINPTPLLMNIRNDLVVRLKKLRFPIPHKSLLGEYAPHIAIAKLYSMSRGVGMPDEPISMTFAARDAYLYQSHFGKGTVRYTKEVRIPLGM